MVKCFRAFNIAFYINSVIALLLKCARSSLRYTTAKLKCLRVFMKFGDFTVVWFEVNVTEWTECNIALFQR